MLFNSIDFIIFLPIVFFLYWFVVYKNLKYQNLLIVLASYFFYGSWDWKFLILIIFSTVVDYFIGLKLSKEEVLFKRKLLLGLSIVINLGFLGFFKYYNFFIDSFVSTFSFFGVGIEARSLNIILPVGISFYTFQTLSYTIDIYKRKIQPTKDFIMFAAFVSFFPQLVAGPIERAENLLSQFSRPKNFKFINIQFGFIRILWGLFKKVVIADRLAIIVNTTYNAPEDYGGLHFIVATVFFAFQIYCDFSGYSDIAIGTARMFNIKLMENFRTPYFSKSLGEFWRNWHISLSTWFRDYVYIPLGGNKVAKLRWYTNILIVFVVSGFWHGARWTFIIWGAIHGTILILESIFTSVKIKNRIINLKYINTFKILVTFSITCFAWVFFRANSTQEAFFIINKFVDFSTPLVANLRGQELYFNQPLWKLMASIALILVLILLEYLIRENKINEIILIQKSILVRWCVYLTVILTILFFGVFETNEFIYFQF